MSISFLDIFFFINSLFARYVILYQCPVVSKTMLIRNAAGCQRCFHQISSVCSNVWKTWRLIPRKFYWNLWVHISLRFLLKFLSFYMFLGEKLQGNKFSIEWKFQGNFNEWQFCRNDMEIIQNLCGNSIALILQLEGYNFEVRWKWK